MLFVDEGAYHQEDLEVSAEDAREYDRLIDYLQEDEALQKRIYLDTDRLCAAWVLE